MFCVVIYLKAAVFTPCLLLLLQMVTLDVYLCCLIVTDLQFSHTLLGRPVPFASAGDCYSAAKCPQVSELLFIVAIYKCVFNMCALWHMFCKWPPGQTNKIFSYSFLGLMQIFHWVMQYIDLLHYLMDMLISILYWTFSLYLSRRSSGAISKNHC